MMLSKIRFSAWLVLSFFLVLTLLLQAGDDLRLNRFSLQTVKAEERDSIPEFTSVERNCQARWIVAAQAQDLPAQGELLPCSPLYMDMIHDLAPTDAVLAALARELYPNLAEPLYWLAESNGGYSAPENLSIYQQIVSEHPQEGLAWCYLGYQYERAGDLQASLEARINCCYNGDPGSNGCYNAGRLYEQAGDIENAIKYYLLSKWQPSREKASELKP